jgi:hypothetical protein
MTPTASVMDLPLRVNYALSSAGRSDLNWIDNETGDQIRLVYAVRDSEGAVHYRYCDALTVGLRPEGYNVIFSRLDLNQVGALEVFLIDPRPPRQAPTSDFSDSCSDLPPGAKYDSWTASLYHIGTINLIYMLETVLGTGGSGGAPVPDDGTVEIIPYGVTAHGPGLAPINIPTHIPVPPLPPPPLLIP